MSQWQRHGAAGQGWFRQVCAWLEGQGVAAGSGRGRTRGEYGLGGDLGQLWKTLAAGYSRFGAGRMVR